MPKKIKSNRRKNNSKSNLKKNKKNNSKKVKCVPGTSPLTVNGKKICDEDVHQWRNNKV